MWKFYLYMKEGIFTNGQENNNVNDSRWIWHK